MATLKIILRLGMLGAGFGMVASTAAAAGAVTLDDVIAPGTQWREIAGGYGFTEGPAADAHGNVYFSDGKNNSIHFYEVGKGVSVFVSDSTDANGMMMNSKGELYVCEGAAYRVVKFDVKTKKKTVLVSEIDGTHFNEPNDLAIDEVDGFYFTDPCYSHAGQKAVMKEDVYYVSPQGKVTRVSTVCKKPNGVLLTADFKTLYLADNGGRKIYKYDVKSPGVLANEQSWIDLPGGPDGMTLDEQGNLYIACGKIGVCVYTPQGKQIGVIAVPYASNVVFGGKDFRTLFITSRDKFLAIDTKVRGVKPLCAR
ncbi:MAG: SMP-30/gluconolactonase/LRE family protein [Candidatus Sumerlaeia bacterium]|nr:SMP-30/gluconolactonase/LRE family protein [Candidatus Sumerlaeia bacterium]